MIRSLSENTPKNDRRFPWGMRNEDFVEEWPILCDPVARIDGPRRNVGYNPTKYLESQYPSKGVYNNEQGFSDEENNHVVECQDVTAPSINTSTEGVETGFNFESTSDTFPSDTAEVPTAQTLKSVHFNPDTIFSDLESRNLASPFWFRIEEDRKRRQLRRRKSRSEMDGILVRLHPNARRQLPNLSKQNGGACRIGNVRPVMNKANQSPPPRKTGTVTSTAVGLRNSLAHFFGCFSPKIRRPHPGS